MKKIIAVGVTILTFALVFNSCSNSSSTTTTSGGTTSPNTSRDTSSYTYSTTSNVGDYAEWTFDGTTVSATWQEVSSTGAIDRTYIVSASCGTFNSNYGYYTCTIDAAASSCTAGALSCSGSPSGTFDMMEVPNTAIFVHTNGGTEQLHVGLLKDSTACSVDVSGDYTFARTGVGSRDLFGVYRTDSNFLNVTHADFSMLSSSATTTPTIRYSTNDSSGTGVVALGDGGCSSGVRTRTANSSTLRAMLTNSGLFILDMPAGQGGLVSFKTSKAAVLADFAGKTFGGIAFPDNGSPGPLSIVMGAVSGTAVAISGDKSGSAIVAELHPVTDTASTATNPSFPNFTSTPTSSTAGYLYSSNSLSATFANPSTIPGLFKIEQSSGGDTGRVVMAAAKLNSKIVAFGFVYNYRTSGQTNPATSSPYSPDLYNTGNFILFER